MSSYWHSIAYFFRLPLKIQWRTALVQLPRFVPLSILHITSPKGPHPFLLALPSRKGNLIYVYVFVPPKPVDLEGNSDDERKRTGEWHVPVVLDFHGGGFIMVEGPMYELHVRHELTSYQRSRDLRSSKHHMLR
jgi:ATP-dependent RNA helicase DDX3X